MHTAERKFSLTPKAAEGPDGSAEYDYLVVDGIFRRIGSSSFKCPLRPMAGNRIGSSARKRFPHTRSDGSMVPRTVAGNISREATTLIGNISGEAMRYTPELIELCVRWYVL